MARCLLHRVCAVGIVAALAMTSRTARAEEDKFRLELGPFLAGFTNTYGVWGGTSARLWLLDSTGQRGLSGYVNIVDLEWVPSGGNLAHSTFFLGRVMKFWDPRVYTMTTLGATAFDPLFPRVQAETEVNVIAADAPGGFVLTVGAGDRYYPAVNRPYFVVGGSYALPRMSISYRYWYTGALASESSGTHLFTFSYGARLDVWFRVDLLWGDESQQTGLLFATAVESRGMGLTLEKWINEHWGILVNPELTEIVVHADKDLRLQRWQLLTRGFVTF